MTTPTSSLLSIYVIYCRPADHPTGYVVRRWDIAANDPNPVPDESPTYHPTLATARQSVPPGLVRIPCSHPTQPNIVEAWI